jgi:hypothetical protein
MMEKVERLFHSCITPPSHTHFTPRLLVYPVVHARSQTHGQQTASSTSTHPYHTSRPAPVQQHDQSSPRERPAELDAPTPNDALKRENILWGRDVTMMMIYSRREVVQKRRKRREEGGVVNTSQKSQRGRALKARPYSITASLLQRPIQHPWRLADSRVWGISLAPVGSVSRSLLYREN